MNFTEKSKKQMDSCRFCWMCRHICPIGNANGQERDNARARMLALSLVARGAAELTPDLVDNLYECSLCGACVKECVTGWDPVSVVRETRAAVALAGKLPEYVGKMLDAYEASGNVYGIKPDAELTQALSAHAAKTNTLLYLGADVRAKLPACAIDAAALLAKAGKPFTVLADEPESGAQLDFLLGATGETKAAMQKAADVLNGFETVVVYAPDDLKAMRRTYAEYGITLSAKTVSFPAYCAELIASGALAPKKAALTVTFQDPAMLARELSETETERAVVTACAELKEMLLHGKDTMLAGSLLMAQYMEKTMQLVARDRWTNVRGSGASVVVTADPAEYALLTATKPDDLELLSLEQLLLAVC